jgi:hypothetical protein
VVTEGKEVFEKGVAENFVDGVVAADVFARDEEFAGGGEESCGVEAAGGIECFLRRPKFGREREQNGERNFERLFDGCELLVDGFDGSFAAEAATGGAENVAGEAREIESDVGREENVEDVAGESGFWRGTAMGDFGDVGAAFENAFRQEKAGGEFFVVAGSAHGDGDGFAADADFERFFDCEGIVVGDGSSVRRKARYCGLNAGVGGEF